MALDETPPHYGRAWLLAELSSLSLRVPYGRTGLSLHPVKKYMYTHVLINDTYTKYHPEYVLFRKG